MVIDNTDRASDEEQNRIRDLAVRILRCSKVKIIMPLRKTSMAVFNRFAGLQEIVSSSMELAALDLREMIRKRFYFSEKGEDLSKTSPIVDSLYGDSYRFPELFEKIFGSEAGELIFSIAGSNARVALHLTSRFIESDQMKGLKNVSNPEYTIAGLMLEDSSREEIGEPYIINLFDSGEPAHLSGYGLIRFRVLEYFRGGTEVYTFNEGFQNHFERLGYSLECLKRVLGTFLMHELIESTEGLNIEKIKDMDINDIGGLKITSIGYTYFRNLLNKMWYFVGVKKSTRFPFRYLGTDRKGRRYITKKK